MSHTHHHHHAESVESSGKPKPTIEIVPIREAVKSDEETLLTVLVRVVPPATEATGNRPGLNVALVLDRSGSMSGSKIKAAKAAASYAVSQLAPTDRLSVTVYDDQVQTIVPSTLARDKASITRAIARVQPGGSTALHAGWLEGGAQVSAHLDTARLNRVLLLTDGLANSGETSTDRICSHVSGLSKRGVSTSTLGVGTDFNEDLLQAMQEAGDGNYYFVEGAADLERIFATEFQGLMATMGQKVSLGVEAGTKSGSDVLADVLNDLPRNALGRLMLPNLVAGNALEIVLTLRVPPPRGESDVCFLRLAWDAPGQNGRQVTREVLSLPSVAASEWDALEENVRVKRAAALGDATRMRQSAVEQIERGDVDGARTSISLMSRSLEQNYDDSDPFADEVLQSELAEVRELSSRLESGDVAAATKMAKFKNHRSRRSQK